MTICAENPLLNLPAGGTLVVTHAAPHIPGTPHNQRGEGVSGLPVLWASGIIVIRLLYWAWMDLKTPVIQLDRWFVTQCA